MGNWTSIIIIPLVVDAGSLINHCNQYLKEKYDGDEYPLFTNLEMSFTPDVLVGNFPYLDIDRLISHIQTWFHPEPTYRVVDEAEEPTKYLSQSYVQANERWGTIQLIIQCEHDGRFWLCNITKDTIERLGLEGMPIS